MKKTIKSYWVYCDKRKENFLVNGWVKAKPDSTIWHEGQLHIITECKRRNRICIQTRDITL